ncbi:hypothetical protein [Paractinoplanes durhamensis]|uniref:Peptidoglycan binding domain-containing protein n=1 Tax=Paractinoplanes durhamensis TaxID=113563 RepID=A0ABQ3YPA4_9ACTN|nr:hypothetical protein [Actinoplanes durhamensis]GID99381.1 hypothetical protein Adu01nite_07320 [Actinoplanes durhamensis]
MDDPERFDVRRAVLVGVLVTVLLLVAGVVAYRMNGDVPHGTRMLGVELGGLSRSEAEEALRDPVARHAADPVRIFLEGRPTAFPPAALGVAVDVELSVGRAIRGGQSPVVRVDKPRLEAALRSSLPPGPITDDDRVLDVDRAVRAIRAAWPRGEVAEVRLVHSRA